MHKLTTSLAAIALATSGLSAQQVTIPTLFDGVEAGSTGNIWRAGINRYQCVWDSSHFTGVGISHPIDIHTIEYRLDGGLAGAPVFYPNVEIYVDNCVNDHAALSTSFAANRTQALPRTPDYAGPVNVIPASGATPNDWVVSIPLTTPFTYVPDAGQDLMVELVILDPPSPLTTSTMSSAFSIGAHQCAAVRSVGSTTAVTGSLTAFCPVLRVGYIDSPGAAKHVTYGSGCYSSAVSWYEEFPGSANDLSGLTVTATQNAAGGYDVATAPLGAFVAPTTVGLALGDDVVSAAIPLPFAFDYPGGSTNSIVVDSNGRVLLSGTTGSSIGGSPIVSTPVNVLCPAWTDLHPDGATNVDNIFVEQNLAGTEFYITWNNVSTFPNTAAGPNSTFQVALIDNGTSDSVEFRYVALVNDSTSLTGLATVGFSPGGGAVEPGSSDLTAGPISTSPDAFPLALSAAPRPTLGATCTYTLDNVRANTGVSAIYASFFGGAATPLSAYGLLDAVGCVAQIHIATAVTWGDLMLTAPTASTSFTVPNNPVFTGAVLYLQGLELAPAENGDGIITSNGLRMQVGTL